jgi:hypothetical protein
LLAFCGLDFHRKIRFYPVTTILNAERNEKKNILDALRIGDFMAQSPYFDVGSDGKISWLKRYSIYIASSLLNMIRNTREQFD